MSPLFKKIFGFSVILHIILSLSFLLNIQSVFAGDPAPPTSPVTFENPIGYNNVETLLSAILKTIQSIIGALAMVFLVVGAIIYITSAGDEGRTRTAKSAIWAAVIGLSLAFAAPSFLREIYGVLETKKKLIPKEAQVAQTMTEITMNVLKVLLGFIGTLSVLMIIVGGVIYITSAGDEKRSEMGKKTVIYSLIGIIIALTSLIIVTQLARIIVGG